MGVYNMAGEKKFGGSLFGYNKKDVYNFIEKLTNEFEGEIESKNKLIQDLKYDKEKLQNEINSLRDELNKIENDRSYIAEAIIKAERQAKDIVDRAIVEANKKKDELLIKIEDEKGRFNKVKGELYELKVNAINTIKNYQSQLEDLIKDKKGGISKLFDKEFNNDLKEIEEDAEEVFEAEDKEKKENFEN
jgi:cell division initiation protein